MNDSALTCPFPVPTGDSVLLAHGEGARLTRCLIRETILPNLGNPLLRLLGDGVSLPPFRGVPVVTTDSFVVSPLFFPGGDIGTLAVHGAVNDLAMCGARPLHLTLALILEEGLSLATLRRVLASIARAAVECEVQVVAGDTKVVPRGAADGLFLSIAALGERAADWDLGFHRIRPGDRMLVSGTVGDHGLAVLAARENFGFEPAPTSDTAPLHELAACLLQAVPEVRFLRDPTRGGVAAVAHEIAEATGFSVRIDENEVPINPAARGASELLGLDPLFIANEGKLIAIVPAECVETSLAALRAHSLGHRAAAIGEILPGQPAAVWASNAFGSARLLDEPSGAPLPRIC